jgi:hypothetical protein
LGNPDGLLTEKKLAIAVQNGQEPKIRIQKARE